MKPSVSIIIPYYNIEPALLQRAIVSVCCLEGYADWELLIIDDGTSESKASVIIEGIHNSNIKYFYQPNCGVAETRNKGISMANKEYILFLDADDYLFTTPLIACMDLISNEHPDMLSFNHMCIDHKLFVDRSCKDLPIIFNGTGCDFMTHHNIHGNPWHFFFRKEIAHDIKFPDHIYHEDEEFAALIYLRPHKLLVTSAIVYAYYQRPGSRMHQTNLKQIEKHYIDYVSVIFHLQDHLPTLSKIEQVALTRRIETLTSALLFLLIREHLSKPFIISVLNRLKARKLFPLRIHLYTWPHFIICVLTFTPSLLLFTKRIVLYLEKIKYIKNIVESRK